MSEEDENNYENSEIFWICNQKIIKNKVRDHCHIKVLHIKNAIQNWE